MRTRLALVTTVILFAGLLAVAAAGAADTAMDGTSKRFAPSERATDNLGWSENDVSDEPDLTDDDNGFPSPGFSPSAETLVLDAYVETRAGSAALPVTHDEDVDAVRHNVMPGTNHANGEETITPGQASYEAWWGRWVDTGSGGDFQGTPVAGPVLGGGADGRIDDAPDCSGEPWDEFSWRGPHVDDSCGVAAQDLMLAFVQPGSHDVHANTLAAGCTCPVDAVLANHSDHPARPDFVMENAVDGDDGAAVWRQAEGFSRIEYDQSFLVSTEVVTAVNPKEIGVISGDGRTLYDPLTPGTVATDADHAADVDYYSTADPTVELLYQMTVWDPHDKASSPFGLIDNQGPKHLAKHEGHLVYRAVEDTVSEEVRQTHEPLHPMVGAATDPLFTVYTHEPNHVDDTHHASLDASYGSIPDYYQVNDQDYSAYQNGERFWVDAHVDVDTLPVWIPFCCTTYGSHSGAAPELPETSPFQTFGEGNDDTKSPGVIRVHAHLGTWFDENQDTWIGDPDSDSSDEGDWYDDGTTRDPNEYETDEFRGTCSAAFRTSKLVPTSDTDGDGLADWGRAGVYVVGDVDDANPYSDAVMDLGGAEVTVATAPVRAADPTGVAEYLAPADNGLRLDRYRVNGPIDIADAWDAASTNCLAEGEWTNSIALVLPTGTLDFSFEAVNEVELTDKSRVSHHGNNAGIVLTGETVTDVDTFDAVTASGGP